MKEKIAILEEVITTIKPVKTTIKPVKIVLMLLSNTLHFPLQRQIAIGSLANQGQSMLHGILVSIGVLILLINGE